jgi:hypothetical protein
MRDIFLKRKFKEACKMTEDRNLQAHDISNMLRESGCEEWEVKGIMVLVAERLFRQMKRKILSAR